MGDFKTSKNTSTTTVDPAVAKDSHALINMFKALASSGYEPNRGVTVADLTPQQKDAMNAADDATLAFGGTVSDRSGGPVPETSASGVEGFRTDAEYDESVAALSPEKTQALNKFYKSMGKQTKYKQYSGSGGGKK